MLIKTILTKYTNNYKLLKHTSANTKTYEHHNKSYLKHVLKFKTYLTNDIKNTNNTKTNTTHTTTTTTTTEP